MLALSGTGLWRCEVWSVHLCPLCVGAQFEWILDTAGHGMCMSLSTGRCEEMYSEMQMLKIVSGCAERRKKWWRLHVSEWNLNVRYYVLSPCLVKVGQVGTDIRTHIPDDLGHGNGLWWEYVKRKRLERGRQEWKEWQLFEESEDE